MLYVDFFPSIQGVYLLIKNERNYSKENTKYNHQT